jgi:NAD(P)H-quinone oxidoreductase subunit 4
MWELELIPVYLLLAMWGGRRRLYSATKFSIMYSRRFYILLAAILTISLWGNNGPST